MNRRGLMLSSGLHLAVFVGVLLGPAPPEFEWEPQEAIAVDLVTPIEIPARPEAREARPLPEEKLEPPVPEPVPEPEPEPKVEPPKEDPPPDRTPVTSPKKPRPPRKYQRVAPKREESKPTLEERLRARLEADQLPVPTEPVAPPPKPVATSAAEVQAQDFPYAWYLNILRTRITDAWDPPGDRMIADRSDRVLVHLQVYRDGRVKDVKVEASGNPSLDASARRAVESAQPFPPLPETWEGDVLDVRVRFTVEGDA